MSRKHIELVYQILCEDVRLEIGNKLSLMGVFQDIFVPQLPVGVTKMAIVNHWRGQGRFLTEVRILYPGKQQPMAISQPAPFEIPEGGYANNITFFMNLTLDQPGQYVIQTLIDSTLFDERYMTVGIAREVGYEGMSDDDLVQ